MSEARLILTPEYRVVRSRQLLEELARLWMVPATAVHVDVHQVTRGLYDHAPGPVTGFYDRVMDQRWCVKRVVDTSTTPGGVGGVELYCAHHEDGADCVAD